MLQNLHVKNLALIDEIEVEFEEGLNILTGETGAGKSIILGSVNLALGGRYTNDVLRQGAEYGLVELTFLVENEKQIQKLKELDIYPEDAAVVLSRRLMEKRSVSKINGETVSMGTLRSAASVLIDIHGQHEHQSLLYKKNHLEIVDMFAGELVSSVKEKTREAFKTLRICEKELEAADMDESQRVKELAFFTFEMEEIDKACLAPGEDEELETEYRRMTNSRKIVSSVEEAYSLTSVQDQSASAMLSRAIRALSEASDYDAQAEKLYEQLVEVDSLLNDFNRDLADYGKLCEYSEKEYYETENRLNELNRLKQKYGNTLEDILEYGREQSEKIRKLEDYEAYLSSLTEAVKKAEKDYKKHAQLLSELRKEQSHILGKEIELGLREMNFTDVKFAISYETLAGYSENGMDDVEFLISLNPGEPIRPLANVASGGELSRIMLAIKTVMAKRDSIETLIFDEIDVGISGRTAQKVSEKMALIGKNHQVICITHLAQIAAMADAHYLIQKTSAHKHTRTEIAKLNEKESVQELARILGGARITEAVIQNAVEMKELCKTYKINQSEN